MPVIGTFIYNKLMTPIKIDFIFRKKFFSRSQLITSKIEDTYYQAAHSNNSNGKYLYSSILSNYININMYHAIKNINTPINETGIAQKGMKAALAVPKNIYVTALTKAMASTIALITS